MATREAAYELLRNMSLMSATNEVYTAAWGIWFWPIIFIFTLILLYIKTESPAYVTIYAILGNVILASFLPIRTHPIFYMVLVLSLALTLWSFYGSKKIE